jgi:hypothetical protein
MLLALLHIGARELQSTVDSELSLFSKSNEYLLKIMKIERTKAVIGTMQAFFDAVLHETVIIKPKD